MEKRIRIGGRQYLLESDDTYLEAMGAVFEPHMVKLFEALIEPDDVVADIGANIGLTAILFSQLAHKVIAFEPSASTYEILTANLARARVTNVEAINVGLGEAPDSKTITFARDNRSGGYVSEKIRPEGGHVTEQIQIRTLDHLFAQREALPDFLKIDVEGFELNVLKGGLDVLRGSRPTVVMEMNHFCLNVLQRIALPDFLDFARARFPFLYAVDRDNVAIIDLHQPDQAYFAMHEHVVRHRFPNVVAGFDPAIRSKLQTLATASSGGSSDVREPSRGRLLIARWLNKAAARVVAGKPV